MLWAAEQVGGIDGLDDRLDLAGYPHADRECDSGCWAVPEGWGPAEELPEPTIAEPVVVPYPTPLPGPPARLRFNQDTKTWEAR